MRWSTLGLGMVMLGACKAPADKPAAAPNVPLRPAPQQLSYSGPPLRHVGLVHGLTVSLYDPGPTQADFHITLLLPQGSAHESWDAPGAAQQAAAMLEHAGDQALTGETLEAHLLALGVERAATAYPEHLALTFTGPAPLAPAMTALLCQQVHHPHWDDSAVEEAALDLAQADEERTLGNTALAQEVLLAFLYPNHPLGNPALAAQPLPTPKVLTFLHAAATAPGALLLAGTTQFQEILTAAQNCDVPLEAPVPALPELPPLNQGPLRVGVVVPDRGQVFLRYGARGPPPGSLAWRALHVTMETLGNGFSSLLVAELRTRRGLVYGVDAGVLSTKSASAWFVGTSTSSQDAPTVAAVMLESMARLHTRGLEAGRWRAAGYASALSFAEGTDTLGGLLALEVDNFRLGLEPHASWHAPLAVWNMDAAWAVEAVRPYLDPAGAVLVTVGAETSLDPKDPLRILAQDWPPQNVANP